MQITDDIMAIAKEMNLGTEAARGLALIAAVVGRYNLHFEKLHDDLRASNNELLDRARAAEPIAAQALLAKLSPFELDVLAYCAGEVQTITPGAALNAALETLRGHGLLDRMLNPNDLSKAVLRARRAQTDG